MKKMEKKVKKTQKNTKFTLFLIKKGNFCLKNEKK